MFVRMLKVGVLSIVTVQMYPSNLVLAWEGRHHAKLALVLFGEGLYMESGNGLPDPGRSIIARLAGIGSSKSILGALTVRANIVGLSDASHDAVLTPREPGGVSHAMRAALAVRMARHNADDSVAAHYTRMMTEAGAADNIAAIADPNYMPPEPLPLAAIVRHIDLLTTTPREATKGDIDALRNAGVEEPDIVRIAELAAFISFQIRFVAGLRLLESTQ
jgi:uncharacterized protein YciW